jgi:hypothetical protein
MATPDGFFCGRKIIASLGMVEEGEKCEVPRTWKERLFSLPWRPLLKTKIITPMVPKQEALVMPDGTFVMHPSMLDKLNKLKKGFNLKNDNYESNRFNGPSWK